MPVLAVQSERAATARLLDRMLALGADPAPGCSRAVKLAMVTFHLHRLSIAFHESGTFTAFRCAAESLKIAR